MAEELSKICKYRGAEVVPVYGGARLGPQIKAIENGAPVIVGTPGRVIDLIDRGVLRLDRVRTVVLDEADQMLDIGFLPAIRRILRATPRGRQTALFTATVPTMIKRLIYSYLNDPEWFRVGEESEPVEQVTQRYVEVARRDKLTALLELLDRNEQTLVFRRTQEDVDWLVRSLKRRDVRVEAIHGGLPQGERNAVMQDFRDGKLKLLVSTNLTSRGIDVPSVANVINYDIPETVEEYVHRIGRTARMGREGPRGHLRKRVGPGLLRRHQGPHRRRLGSCGALALQGRRSRRRLARPVQSSRPRGGTEEGVCYPTAPCAHHSFFHAPSGKTPARPRPSATGSCSARA